MAAERSIGRAFVIGGGLAGLTTALHLCDRGIEVTVLETSPHLGGRSRSYSDPELGLLDNGTHALTSANPAALSLLRRLGVRERWRASADGPLRLVDLAEERLFTVSPRLSDFVALGLRPHHVLKLFGPDRPVASMFDTASPGYRRLIEPLTVAALNTPAEEASSRLLGRVFVGAWRGPSALIPLVAERGLGPDLVEPLAEAIRVKGGTIETAKRIRRLDRQEGRIAAFEIGDQRIQLGSRDRVILAVPPTEVERLTGSTFGFNFSPIVNAHFAVGEDSAGPPRLLAVLGATAQWILLRGAVASVTVSAADALADEPSEHVAERLWKDVHGALRLAGLSPPEAPRASRIVKERRATIRQTPGLRRPGAVTAWGNLFLAGDWTRTGLPATIEGAVRSGRTAARAALSSLEREEVR